MSENLKKVGTGSRYEYTDTNGKKIIFERSALRDHKGGIALRVMNDGYGGFSFIHPDDVDDVLAMMAELRKKPCTYCDGTGTV